MDKVIAFIPADNIEVIATCTLQVIIASPADNCVCRIRSDDRVVKFSPLPCGRGKKVVLRPDGAVTKDDFFNTRP